MKNFRYFIYVIGMLTLFAGCSDNDSAVPVPDNDKQVGSITINGSLNTYQKQVDTRATTLVPLTDFEGYVLVINGETVELPANGTIEGLLPGGYELEMSNMTGYYTPAFNDPRYTGSETVEVYPALNTEAALELQQVNAGVFFFYDETVAAAGLGDMVPLVRAGSYTLDYSGEAEKHEAKGYFAPGEVVVTMMSGEQIVTVGGKPTKTYEVDAGQLIRINVSVAGSRAEGPVDLLMSAEIVG